MTGYRGAPDRRAQAPLAFDAGAAIGVLGGMIGPGGAEFRLPLLIGLFGFAALSPVTTDRQWAATYTPAARVRSWAMAARTAGSTQ